MEQERPFKERRKYVRLNTCVEVKYTIIGKPGAVKVSSKNISAGGLCLTIGEPLAVDTPLQLDIIIPDLKDPIHALGRVVWQKKVESQDTQSKAHFDTGIEFTGLSDFDLFNINRYVMERVNEEDGDKQKDK